MDSGIDTKKNSHKKRGDANYQLVRHHLDYYLGQVLEHDHEFLHTMDEIRKKVDDKTGVFFHGATIEKYIKRYKEKHGESPLCQVGDKYRLNHCYYSYAKIKPPRTRKYKIQL